MLSKEPTDPRIQGQPIRYAGYVYDTETKLYYLQARYYDPATARFISRDLDTGDEDDPITMNGYSYADGNPVMMVDADGNMAHLVVYYAIVGGRTLYMSCKTYKALKKAGKVVRVARTSKVAKGVGKSKWWHPGYVNNLSSTQILLGVKRSSKGLSTLGSTSRANALNAGKAWAGNGAKPIYSSGQLIGYSSKDGMRAFRLQFKNNEQM